MKTPIADCSLDMVSEGCLQVRDLDLVNHEEIIASPATGIFLTAPVLGVLTTVSEKNEKDVDSLIQALKDNYTSVRRSTARALGNLKNS